MSQQEKAAYFQALKKAGVEFDRHYRTYTTEELQAAYAKLMEGTGEPPHLPPVEQPKSQPEQNPVAGELPPQSEHGLFSMDADPEPPAEDPDLDAAASSFFGLQRPAPPERAADPREMPGQRQNSQDEDEPIRTDPVTGRVWYQEEVAKPAYPKPRGRRVLTFADPGVKTQTIKRGDYIESFEVAGDEVGRTSEVKITLPSYQVGIYKDPRFPFKVHTYNGVEGFDLANVRDYYGGAELVPPEVKRVYVANVLCYDIRTTVRAINDEYRQLVLQKKV